MAAHSSTPVLHQSPINLGPLINPCNKILFYFFFFFYISVSWGQRCQSIPKEAQLLAAKLERMRRGGQKRALTSRIKEFVIGALHRVFEDILHVPLSTTESSQTSWKYRETHINQRECSPGLQASKKKNTVTNSLCRWLKRIHLVRTHTLISKRQPEFSR